MEYLHELNIIKDNINNQLSDYPNNRIVKLNDNDFIIKNGWLFVNMDSTKYYSGVSVYKYPVNEYLEMHTTVINYYGKPFNQFLDDIDFNNKYPKLKVGLNDNQRKVVKKYNKHFNLNS